MASHWIIVSAMKDGNSNKNGRARSVMLTVRLTKEEAEDAREIARQYGLGISAFARLLIKLFKAGKISI